CKDDRSCENCSASKCPFHAPDLWAIVTTACCGFVATIIVGNYDDRTAVAYVELHMESLLRELERSET
ncbi:MAG: hypothetical protein WBE52_05385, partial [Terriglobales bacterium]